MAMALQRAYRLPVLAIRLGQIEGRPCADLRLVDNSGDELKVLYDKLVPLEEFGCGDAIPDQATELKIPPEVTEWVGDWVHGTFAPDSVLWLHFVKPYGVLGAAPWERDLQPAVGVPLVRLPDALPVQDRSSSVFDLALVATSPAPEGISTAVLDAPPVARAIAAGVGERLRLHVFADAVARDFLQGELADLPVRSVTVHEFYESRRGFDAPSDLRNGWLRWVTRAMHGFNLDAVHFILHGNAVGQDGAVLTPLEPESIDRAVPVSVQSGEIQKFLTQVGALVAGFSRPLDNYSDFGLRRFVDELGAVRAAPVLLHDPTLDPDLAGLRDAYAFLSAQTPGVPPATPSLTLFAQPKSVYQADAVELPTSVGDDAPSPPPTASVQEHFARDDTPMWLAAAERYLEQQQGDLQRFHQSAVQRTPTASEQAYYSGVETAVRKVREVVDKHAQEQL